jgi:hypothetical protein
MNTRQYTKSERKALKRAQRTPGYVSLQQKAREHTAELDSALRIRNARIEKLEKMILDTTHVDSEGNVLTKTAPPDEVKAEVLTIKARTA